MSDDQEIKCIFEEHLNKTKFEVDRLVEGKPKRKIDVENHWPWKSVLQRRFTHWDSLKHFNSPDPKVLQKRLDFPHASVRNIMNAELFAGRLLKESDPEVPNDTIPRCVSKETPMTLCKIFLSLLPFLYVIYEFLIPTRNSISMRVVRS